MTLNAAVLAPIASAIDAIAATLTPRRRRIIRHDHLMSCPSACPSGMRGFSDADEIDHRADPQREPAATPAPAFIVIHGRKGLDGVAREVPGDAMREPAGRPRVDAHRPRRARRRRHRAPRMKTRPSRTIAAMRVTSWAACARPAFVTL
jgi:hypothetical protein